MVRQIWRIRHLFLTQLTDDNDYRHIQLCQKWYVEGAAVHTKDIIICATVQFHIKGLARLQRWSPLFDTDPFHPRCCSRGYYSCYSTALLTWHRTYCIKHVINYVHLTANVHLHMINNSTINHDNHSPFNYFLTKPDNWKSLYGEQIRLFNPQIAGLTDQCFSLTDQWLINDWLINVFLFSFRNEEAPTCIEISPPSYLYT